MIGQARIPERIEILGADSPRSARPNKVERTLKIGDCQRQAHLTLPPAGSAVTEPDLVAQFGIAGLMN
jgi:hypothetical protein